MRKMGIGLGVGINRSNYAQGIFGAYATRVVADGGVVESGSCVDAVSSLLQSASLLLIPSGYKGGKLYAEIPTNGNGDLTWTRGGDAFRTNASGVLQRVPWNLAQRSEEFSNAIWSKLNSSITANIINAPNGTLTADKVVEDSTNNTHYNTQQIPNSNSLLTYSIYAKAGERTFLRINAFATLPNNFSYSPIAVFNLSNGTVGTTSACNASIQNVGDGWYRCVMQCTSVFASTSATVNFYNYVSLTDSVFSYQGDGTSGLYLWGAQLVEGTTDQTYLPTTDRLNFPRLSYMYGSCPSALLEPQRTNLVLYSEQFTIANSYLFRQATVTNNTTETTAPDGSNNADKIFPDSSTNLHQILSNDTPNTVSFTSGTTYTQSVFAKLGNGSQGQRLQMLFSSSRFTSLPYANFNLQSGTVTATGGSGTATITALANGWYRCSLTATCNSTGNGGGVFMGLITSDTAAREESFTGNTSHFIYAWGAQLEAGAYPTTYIPTTSATATRVADSFSRSNIYTNGLISASGGTWFVELRGNIGYVRDAGSTGLSLDASALVNGLAIRNTASGRLAIQKFISSTGTLLYTTTTDTTKIAIKWNGTSCDVFANGTKVVSASSFTLTVMENLSLTSGQVPYFIQQMALFPTPLSDTDCTTLTT